MAEHAVTIREALPQDQDEIWRVIAPTIRAGETYAVAQDLTPSAALDYWMDKDRTVFVAESDGRIVGTFYLRVNRPGRGGHVANCGYMTDPQATGRGVARAMCAHSLELARARGFRAMQFNFVVSTNERAVRLWQSMGFAIVGTLPGAFHHPTLGYVDAFIMYSNL